MVLLLVTFMALLSLFMSSGGTRESTSFRTVLWPAPGRRDDEDFSFSRIPFKTKEAITLGTWRYGRQPISRPVAPIPREVLAARPPHVFHFCVIFSRPQEFGLLRDGLGAAFDLISELHYITWEWYSGESHMTSAECLAADYIWSRDGFYGPIDKWVRKTLGHVRHKIAMQETSITMPNREALLWYHAVFYETEWFRNRPQYKALLDLHPRMYQAFGVNTAIFRPREPTGMGTPQSKLFDYMYAGQIDDVLKRVLRITEKSGRRLVVGNTGRQSTVDALRAAGVEVIAEQAAYEDLAALMRMSKIVFVPTADWGGGERLLLEARACGTAVEYAEDNGKLKHLMELPVPNHCLFAQQLLRGFANATGNVVLGIESISDRCDV